MSASASPWDDGRLTFERRSRPDAPDAQPRADAEAWSVMLYTSGTTAKPKGVPRRQRAERAAALAHVAQNLYRSGERTLGVMPLYHTMGVRSLHRHVADRRHFRVPAALSMWRGRWS
jgi:2-furoate---CoA ligase